MKPTTQIPLSSTSLLERSNTAALGNPLGDMGYKELQREGEPTYIEPYAEMSQETPSPAYKKHPPVGHIYNNAFQ